MNGLRKLFGISANEMRFAAQLREMTVTKLQRRKRGAPFETSVKENFEVESLKLDPVALVPDITEAE